MSEVKCGTGRSKDVFAVAVVFDMVAVAVQAVFR